MLHPDLDGNQGQPPNRLLAGKYRDVESLERGYEELQRISNETYTKFQTLEERLNSVERMNPNERQQERRNVMAELDAVGVPGDAIAELVREETQKFLQPMIAAQEARQTIYREIPQFQEREEAVASFLEKNPQDKQRYQRMYQADPAGAMEWAFARYDRLTGDTGPVNDGRNDSRLPASSGGENRSVDGYMNDQEMEQLMVRARQTGDWTQVVAARVSIPDSHFQPYGYNQR